MKCFAQLSLHNTHCCTSQSFIREIMIRSFELLFFFPAISTIWGPEMMGLKTQLAETTARILKKHSVNTKECKL